MATMKFNDQTIKIIALFENITRTTIKDCIELPDTIYFVIDIGQLHKAIGKNGSNIKRMRGLFHKNIKVIEYSADIESFIRNIFREFPIKTVIVEDSIDGKNKVAFVSVNLRDKGKVIGKDSKNLKVAKEIINRHHKVDIKIV